MHFTMHGHTVLSTLFSDLPLEYRSIVRHNLRRNFRDQSLSRGSGVQCLPRTGGIVRITTRRRSVRGINASDIRPLQIIPPCPTAFVKRCEDAASSSWSAWPSNQMAVDGLIGPISGPIHSFVQHWKAEIFSCFLRKVEGWHNLP